MTTNLPLHRRYLRELRELIYLAGPILGAQLATSGMSFVDTSMSGQYSSEDLAAVAIGSGIWMPVYLLIRGILMATTPTVAHLYGASQIDKIAAPVRQGGWIALAFSGLAILFLLNPGPMLDFLQIEAAVQLKTRAYLAALTWGIPAICLYQVLACYCEGRSLTKPGMIFSFAALLLNIPLNYVLIYGKLGFPAMGSVGCGYATAACFWLMGIMMFLYTRYNRKHEAIDLFGQWEWPSASAISSHLKLGVPMGLTIFFEASIFSAVALVIGKLGTVIVAGHQIALNFSGLIFMVPLSLSMGITVRVGQALGARDYRAAKFSSFAGIVTTLITATVSALLMLLYSDQITSIYSHDLAVKTLAAELLIFAALFQYSDGVQVAANGALRGYKDTRIPMVMILIACWGIALPLGYTLGLTDLIVEPMGPHGLWIGLVTALTLSAGFLALRLKAISQRFIDRESSVSAEQQSLVSI